MDTKKLKDKFGKKIREQEFAEGVVRDDKVPVYIVDKAVLVDVCRFARDELGFDQLSFLTAVDYLGKAAEGELPAEEARLEIVYRLSRSDSGGGLMLKFSIKREGEDVPSVYEIWATAGWHEREMYDLFGVKISGHPDLRRILLPDDWDDHPLRKDIDPLAKLNKYQKLNK